MTTKYVIIFVLFLSILNGCNSNKVHEYCNMTNRPCSAKDICVLLASKAISDCKSLLANDQHSCYQNNHKVLDKCLIMKEISQNDNELYEDIVQDLEKINNNLYLE